MFHRPKPKQFKYKAIYSDLEKEEKQDKIDELGELRFKLRREISNKTTSYSKLKGVNIIMYIVIALMLMYYIFFI